MGLLSIDVNDKGIAAKIKELEGKSQQLPALYDRIGAAMVTQVQLGFKAGQSPWGLPWQKPKHRDGQPLRDTGRLNRSVTKAVDGAGVTIGTNVVYARIHQFGGGPVKAHTRLVKQAFGKKLKFPVWANVKARDANIPPRPFLPLSTAGVNMPPAWQKLVIARIKTHFLNLETAGAVCCYPRS